MSRVEQIFFEVFEALPRQGPGNRSSAAKALSLCRDLPPFPAVIDLGCGVGGQTIHLAALTAGTIVALDKHAPSIRQLRQTVIKQGLSQRITPVLGDLLSPAQPSESFDLVWSEGALYNIGIEKALHICHRLLRTGGYLAFTDAVWLKENPPPEIKAIFEEDYSTMGRVSDVLTAIEKCGFSLIGHFPLPDEAWWDDFYTPMRHRIKELHIRYADDAEALAILNQLSQEPEMYQKYSDCYAYEFFVTRRAERGDSTERS
ncbi:MAG: SAM-dependent methyltransferase [spirochete symbiont of Stewartia floridana]|nr:MAG: SAM-dependent methyltransferase [spirochete symbiont of Stewartia floridana]